MLEEFDRLSRVSVVDCGSWLVARGGWLEEVQCDARLVLVQQQTNDQEKAQTL